MDAWLEEMKDGRRETMACQEATEAYPEMMVVNPQKMESIVVHEEVPKEEAAMNLPQRHFVHHKSNMNRPGLEPEPPTWEASDQSAELWRGPMGYLPTGHKPEPLQLHTKSVGLLLVWK
jgi:hypothetical protein